MAHTKQTPPTPVEVPLALKAAIQELITRVGGDGFLMELLADNGQRYYLAFGKPDTIRDFLGTLADDGPMDDLPSIH